MITRLEGFPGGASGEPACQYKRGKRFGFNPWVEKIPWRREKLPTLVLWPGEFHGLYSPRGHKESDMTEQPPNSRKFLKRMCVGRKGNHYGMRSYIS